MGNPKKQASNKSSRRAFDQSANAATDDCWLHTRARKYNLSALGTYFECEGVKRTYLNFS